MLIPGKLYKINEKGLFLYNIRTKNQIDVDISKIDFVMFLYMTDYSAHYQKYCFLFENTIFYILSKPELISSDVERIIT